jgi:hypothetical protein
MTKHSRISVHKRKYFLAYSFCTRSLPFFSSNKWRKFPPSFFQSFNHRSRAQNDRARHSSAVYVFLLSLVRELTYRTMWVVFLSAHTVVYSPHQRKSMHGRILIRLKIVVMKGGGVGEGSCLGEMDLAQLWTSGQCVSPGIWGWARQAQKEVGTDR